MSGSESIPRRERKKLATRAAIHAAALDLTEQLGLAAVTIEAITERADVAPRTFFNYFPSKEEAIIDREPGRAERLGAALAARPAAESPLEALRAVLVENMILEGGPAVLWRKVRIIHAEPQLHSCLSASFDRLQSSLVEAIAERTGLDADRDFYPTVVVAAAISATRTSFIRWANDDGRQLSELFDEAFDHLATGLAVPHPQPLSHQQRTAS